MRTFARLLTTFKAACMILLGLATTPALGGRQARRSRESGGTMVEFSLVLLPLLGFVFLIMDVAWAIFARSAIQEGVREGVRFAVVGTPYSGQCLGASVQQVVKSYSFGFITSNNLSSVTTTYYSPTTFAQVTGSGSTAGGNIVQVSVSGISVVPLAPVWQGKTGFLSTPLSLSSVATDVMESNPYPPCP